MDDRFFAHHCGAVLLHKKPAALFAVKAKYEMLRFVCMAAQESGLAVQTLRRGEKQVLLLVYHPQLLQTALQNTMAAKMLAKQGYPVGTGLTGMLRHLKTRVAAGPGFPHEIGFFLGYPPADVVGFMLYGDKHCKHSCMWKVYSDVEKAKQLCREYEQCRAACCRHIEKGGSIASLQSVVPAAG